MAPPLEFHRPESKLSRSLPNYVKQVTRQTAERLGWERVPKARSAGGATGGVERTFCSAAKMASVFSGIQIAKH
jgi:hypothetical protein